MITMFWTFGEWIVEFSSNLASKTRRLVPVWRLSQKNFFQHCTQPAALQEKVTLNQEPEREVEPKKRIQQ